MFANQINKTKFKDNAMKISPRNSFCIALLMAVLSLLSLSNPLYAQNGISTGEKAPNIAFPDANGNEVSLSSLKGNIVLLYFWVSWEPNTEVISPNLAILHDKYQYAQFADGAKGFKIYTVSLDGDRSEWINAMYRYQFPGAFHVNDFYSKSASEYGFTKLPSWYLLDENNNVIGIDLSMSAIDRALAGRATSFTTTRQHTPNTNATTQASETASAKPEVFSTSTATSTSDLTPPAKSPQGKHYKIQLGAYKYLNSALFDNAKPFGTLFSDKTESGVFRISLGSYVTATDALNTLIKVKNAGYPDAFLVNYVGEQRGKALNKTELQALAKKEKINFASLFPKVPSVVAARTTASAASTIAPLEPAQETQTTPLQMNVVNANENPFQKPALMNYTPTHSAPTVPTAAQTTPKSNMYTTTMPQAADIIYTPAGTLKAQDDKYNYTPANNNGNQPNFYNIEQVPVYTAGKATNNGIATHTNGGISTSQIPVFVETKPHYERGTYYDQWYPVEATPKTITTSPNYSSNPGTITTPVKREEPAKPRTALPTPSNQVKAERASAPMTMSTPSANNTSAKPTQTAQTVEEENGFKRPAKSTTTTNSDKTGASKSAATVNANKTQTTTPPAPTVQTPPSEAEKAIQVDEYLDNYFRDYEYSATASKRLKAKDKREKKKKD